MRSFAQADKVFDGDEAACQAEDDIDRDKAPELEPGEGRAIDAEPKCLPDNDTGFGGRFIGKTFVEEENNGKDGACQRHEGQDEKSPARPNVGKCLCNEVVQTSPADEDEDQ